MFFKFLIGIFLLVGLGCAKKETPINEPKATAQGAGLSCMGEIKTRVQKFIKGELSASEVSAFWNCLAHTVSEYQSITAGEDYADYYLPKALRRFVGKFVKDLNLSDELLASLMELKRVLLSGGTDRVKRSELTQLKQLIRVLEEFSLKIHPHVKVLFHRQSHATDTEVRLANAAWEGGIGEVSRWLTVRNQDYTFMQLSELMQAFAGSEQERLKANQTVDILISAKRIFVGGQGDRILGSEWAAVGSTLGRGLYVYQAMVYGFSKSLNAGLVTEALPDSLLKMTELLEQSANRHPSAEIPMTEFTDFFKAISASNQLPEAFTEKSLTQVWNFALQRLVGDGSTPVLAMSQNHIRQLRHHFHEWSQLLSLPESDPSKLVQSFNLILSQSRPLAWDAEDRMMFPRLAPSEWGDSNRRHMIWPFVVMRWIQDSYIAEGILTLDGEAMDLAASEILPVLWSFGWLLRTEVSVGRRLLREADLFTLISNGDGHLQVGEGIHFLAFIASSFRAAQVWLQEADLICQDRNATCLRQLPLRTGSTLFSSMPRWQTDLQHWPEKRFIQYMQHAEQTIDREATGEYVVGDLLMVWQLFQYVEAFIQRYDLELSETINFSEGKTAYVTFGPTLTRILVEKGLPEDQVFPFFTFLLKYGETPYTMFGGSVALLNWKLRRDSWAFEANREILMGILFELKQL